MDFLKSAVASAIAKGPPFPYTFGEKVDLDPSIWTLQNGTRREDGSNCSIFSFDVGSNRSSLPLARNALKKLRTLRHPGVIKVLDTVETDSYIYIATERLVPLRWHIKRKSLSPETAKWGLHSIARTVKFINGDASSIHGNLKVASVYTSESGEWKLGGFEVLSNVKDDEAIIYTYGSLVPDSGRYSPPELARSGWDAIKRSPHSATDAYCFGLMVFEVFNGSFMGPDQAGQTKNIPPTMQASYKRLVNANPKARTSVGTFLEQGLRNGSYFDSPLIKLTEGVENLGVKTEEEREEFLDDLDQLSDDFPEDFFKMKVLPELLKSVEFGGGGPKAFGLVMKIANKLPGDDFDTRISPVVIRLFGNPDRAIRVCLLDNLPQMIDKLPQKLVNDRIFPNLVTGFTDLAPIIREQTVKSVLTIITKLSDRTINGELLRCLAKTANDEQPGIRTNTTICLGKIARNLGTSSRARVLIAAFTRSLRDPFVHARCAALMALAATADCFSDEDSAAKILPAMCPLLLDKEKLVRDQANKSTDIFLQRIKKAAASMPDSVLPPPTTAESGPRMSTPQPTESAAASWAGWAISSFTNKISAAAGEIEPSTSTNGTNAASRPDQKRTPNLTATSSASTLHRQAVMSPPATASLSRTSSSGGVGADSYFAEPEPPADYEGDAWGDMDDDDEGGNGDGDKDGDGADFWAEAEGGGGTNNRNKPSTGGTGLLTTSTSPSSKRETKRQVSASGATATATASASKTPFDDDEPDFAGWLAAQAHRKSGGPSGKQLPKGLAKPAAAPKKPPAGANKPAAKPATAKKIDLKPKADDGEDGWGDGW